MAMHAWTLALPGVFVMANAVVFLFIGQCGV
jgi:hypothetical protein